MQNVELRDDDRPMLSTIRRYFSAGIAHKVWRLTVEHSRQPPIVMKDGGSEHQTPNEVRSR